MGILAWVAYCSLLKGPCVVLLSTRPYEEWSMRQPAKRCVAADETSALHELAESCSSQFETES